jgi:hypothetical protein
LEVLRNCRLTDGEGLHQLSNGSLTGREASEDRSPGRVGQRSESPVESVGSINH